ncbi:sigma-54-dependent transcriptional regulator [Syntrophorhabdus aromaticivorans]|uniref:Sigma-54-dependent Fis family transcriptional regulator n=1 Tax=Syntrophorhabdus aromaticivorans TaxID=328301 RepID=A0A351U6D2_9BACT|nr:sigma-54 dependent transcriptional regulator [Syntrophorhabdus aromaticivorans]NLW34876.1 sigma-54-dependent Fis family transcriptional regulator [Syntrophorhabdus aromaticivorans]HBA55513.1 sigma-54-dependent Fis family transcriptional regulator [Syntrophorhabdus aromaticivorans]
MEKGKIIIVEDEESILTMLSEFLRNNGYDVDPFIESKKALFALKSNEYQILITDLAMPHIDGLQLINYIQKEYLNTLGIVMTGYGSLETAISAMRWGAFDYILKPFKFEEVLTIVESAMYYSRLMRNESIPRGLTGKANLLRRFSENKIIRENTILRSCLKDKYKFENIIGISFPMQKVFELIEKVADTNATVLITGESGVGKELVAKAVHYNSSRRDSPLVVVNCGAIPETLLESELFGYEKGAFTGATGTRYGRFELAHGGSMFLDEIGDMSFNLQVKLLRVLQEKTFERVGGSKTVNVDVRIIAATNRVLDDLVKEGKFREDLYYRLNVVPIHLPPLRERRQDIPLLFNYFLERSNKMNSAEIGGCTEEAMSILMEYDYPGNVRELQNLIERVVVLKKKGSIDLEDLPEKIYGEIEAPTRFDIEKGYDTLVSTFEKNLILQALQETNGVKSKAAQILSINRTTLIEKMKRLGID